MSFKKTANDWARPYVEIKLEIWSRKPTYAFRLRRGGKETFITDVPDLGNARDLADILRKAGCTVKSKW